MYQIIDILNSLFSIMVKESNVCITKLFTQNFQNQNLKEVIVHFKQYLQTLI